MAPRVHAPFQLLSPHPQEAITFVTAVERAGRLIMAVRRGLAAEHDLTVPAWRLLAVIARAQRRPGLARIARLLGISRQAVRDMAGDLRERGLLTMPCGPGSRKETLLVLTPEGHTEMAQLDETLRFLLLEMTNDVPPEALTASANLLNGFSARLRRCETILGRRL
jgi:DNA-binding MarR family transcriptional regulator